MRIMYIVGDVMRVWEIWKCVRKISLKLTNLTKAEYHFELGRALYKTDKYEQGINELNKATLMENGVRNADAFYYKGCCHLYIGKLDLAVKDFTKAIDIDGNQAKYYNGRSKTYNKKGGSDNLKYFDLALKDITIAIELERDGDYFHTRGINYNSMKKFELAVKFVSFSDIFLTHFHISQTRITSPTMYIIRMFVTTHFYRSIKPF